MVAVVTIVIGIECKLDRNGTVRPKERVAARVCMSCNAWYGGLAMGRQEMERVYCVVAATTQVGMSRVTHAAYDKQVIAGWENAFLGIKSRLERYVSSGTAGSDSLAASGLEYR